MIKQKKTASLTLFDPEFGLVRYKTYCIESFQVCEHQGPGVPYIFQEALRSLTRWGGVGRTSNIHLTEPCIFEIVEYIMSLLYKLQVVAHMRPVRRFTLAALSDTDGRHRKMLVKHIDTC